jgi:hypothetical protein
MAQAATQADIAAAVAHAIADMNNQLAQRDNLIQQLGQQLTTVTQQAAGLTDQVAAAAAQAAATATTVAARRIPVRYLDPFTNDPARKDENWLVFKRDFILHCRNQGMTGDQAKGALVLSVRGAAALAVHELDPDTFPTLEAMLEAFERKFMPPASSALAQTMFEQAVMRPGDTVLDFHSRLYALYKRAYPNSTDNTLLIRRFSLGVRNIDTRKELLRQRPDTYAAALDIAQTEEAVDRATRSTAMTQAIMPGPTDEPMEINAMGIKTCYKCGKKGHIKIDCRSKEKPKSTGATGGVASRPNGTPKPAFFRNSKDKKAQGFKRLLNLVEAIQSIEGLAEVMDDVGEDDDEESAEQQEDDVPAEEESESSPTGGDF